MLAPMLVPTHQDIWWYAVDALIKIDTDTAAKALQPHLLQETNLRRKLEIAEFLGRHGIRDGYPYAIEHMSEPYLREQAISALAAIREPRAAGELRKIFETSDDIAWNSAAIRALGALGASDFAPQFLEMARNTGNPLGPSALIALGDLHEAKALEISRAGFASRNPERLAASAPAGNLVSLPGVSAGDVRDQLATLLADRGAWQPARLAALNSLLGLNDPRLDGALALAVRDAGLESSDLLNKIEEQLGKRKVRLTLALSKYSLDQAVRALLSNNEKCGPTCYLGNCASITGNESNHRCEKGSDRHRNRAFQKASRRTRANT